MTELFGGDIQTVVSHSIEMYDILSSLVEAAIDEDNDPGSLQLRIQLEDEFDLTYLNDFQSLIIYVGNVMHLDLLTEYEEKDDLKYVMVVLATMIEPLDK